MPQATILSSSVTLYQDPRLEDGTLLSVTIEDRLSPTSETFEALKWSHALELTILHLWQWGRRGFYIRRDYTDGRRGLVWVSSDPTEIVKPSDPQYDDVKRPKQLRSLVEGAFGLTDEGNLIPVWLLQKASQNDGGWARCLFDLERYNVSITVDCEVREHRRTLSPRSDRQVKAHGDPDEYEDLPLETTDEVPVEDTEDTEETSEE